MMERVFSSFMSSLKTGKFIFTGELEPEKTTDLSGVVKEAAQLKDYVVACNVTDNPQSFANISSLVASYIVQRDSGMEVICQLTCRDRNRSAILSDLLGAGALGIRNILALTGDYTTLGDMPQSKPVFDLDSTQLIQMIRIMVDKGVDLNGKAIDHPPKYHVGGGANPNSKPIEPELMKLEKKVRAGAEFLQTQVVFDIDVAKSFLDEVKKYDIPVLIGIFPMKSYGVAEYFDKSVPGVHVPEDLMTAMAKARNVEDKQKKRERYNEINRRYFVDFVKEIKKTTSATGCHIMSVGYREIIPAIVEGAK